MSTVDAWLNEAELDWTRPVRVSPVARDRFRRPSTARARRLRAAATAALVPVACWLALTDFDHPARPSAPPPPTIRAAHASARPAAALTTPQLEAIAQCESRGDPTAVSADGRYRGKYQFDQQTWQAAGGQGDAALTPEPEQDRRAYALASARGTQPWPVCGSAATR